MVERARGLSGVLRERQRSLARALDAAADADVVSTLEAEGARLAEELEGAGPGGRRPRARAGRAAGRRVRRRRPNSRPTWPAGATAAELRRAEEAVTVARGQLASLEHALERDRRTLDQLIARQGAAERRAAVLEGEDHELGERLAETEQSRHRPAGRTGRDRGGARGRHPPPGGGRGDAPPGRTGARTGPRPGPTPSNGRWTRPGARPGPSCWPGSTVWSAPCSTWSRWTAGGRRPSRPPPAPRWPPWSSRAASRPVPRCPDSARVGPPGPSWPSPSRPSSRRVELAGPATPEGTESIRGHVRPRTGGRAYPGLDAVLDTLLHGSCCAQRGWSDAIDLALSRPDLVVVTRDGDRFSPTGWRVRAGGGVVTAAVVDEARERPAVAGREATAADRGAHRRPCRGRGRPARRPPRRCGPTTATRWPTRPPGSGASACRATGTCWAPSWRRSGATGPSSRTASTATPPGWPNWWPGCPSSRTPGSARRAGGRGPRGAPQDRRTHRRGRGRPQRVGGPHRRAGRAAPGAGRAAGRGGAAAHRARRGASAGRRAADPPRGRRHRRRAPAAASWPRRSPAWTRLLSSLRDRHRRQLEAVRAGGARLEELRRRRAVSEHELAATRSRLQKAELDLVEATVRREAVVETLRRELGCGPEDALAAPVPELPDGVDAAARMRAARGRAGRHRTGQPAGHGGAVRAGGAPPVPRVPGGGRAQGPAGPPPGHPHPRRGDHARLRRGLRRRQRALLQPGHLAVPGGHRPAVAHRPREPAGHRGRGRGPPGRPQRPPPVAAVRWRAVARWPWPTCSPCSGAGRRPST